MCGDQLWKKRKQQKWGNPHECNKSLTLRAKGNNFFFLEATLDEDKWYSANNGNQRSSYFSRGCGLYALCFCFSCVLGAGAGVALSLSLSLSGIITKFARIFDGPCRLYRGKSPTMQKYKLSFFISNELIFHLNFKLFLFFSKYFTFCSLFVCKMDQSR